MLSQVKNNSTQNTFRDTCILFHVIALCLTFVKYKNASCESGPSLSKQTDQE